ncbi:hypothetical protein ACVDFE_00215 [Lentzea chajnantorensis]
MHWRGENGTERPDAQVRYRIDAGERVGVLPASCKRGKHSLTQVGYRATTHGDVLHVSCEACAAEPNPDHYWTLQLEGALPARAELDDGPYRDVQPRFISRPVTAGSR